MCQAAIGSFSPLQYFLYLIVLVKCFTFELSFAQCPFLWAKHFQCLFSPMEYSGSSRPCRIIIFFFYLRAFHLGEEHLGRKTNQTGEYLRLIQTKLVFPVSCWIRWMDLTPCTELKWSWQPTDLTPWILPCCGPGGWTGKSVSFLLPSWLQGGCEPWELWVSAFIEALILF